MLNLRHRQFLFFNRYCQNLYQFTFLISEQESIYLSRNPSAWLDGAIFVFAHLKGSSSNPERIGRFVFFTWLLKCKCLRFFVLREVESQRLCRFKKMSRDAHPLPCIPVSEDALVVLCGSAGGLLKDLVST